MAELSESELRRHEESATAGCECVGCRMIAEIRRHRAAQRADAERVRSLVYALAVEAFNTPIDGSSRAVPLDHTFATGLADRVAAKLATAAPVLRVSLPPRKEWDPERCEPYGSDEYESSDYVDGWNDALDAVEESFSGLVLSAEERVTLEYAKVFCTPPPAIEHLTDPVAVDHVKKCHQAAALLDRLLGGAR